MTDARLLRNLNATNQSLAQLTTGQYKLEPANFEREYKRLSKLKEHQDDFFLRLKYACREAVHFNSIAWNRLHYQIQFNWPTSDLADQFYKLVQSSLELHPSRINKNLEPNAVMLSEKAYELLCDIVKINNMPSIEALKDSACALFISLNPEILEAKHLNSYKR